MKNLSIIFTAVRIEWHWWFIKRERKKGNSLMAFGYSLSSPKMLRLNRRLSFHSAKVIEEQKVYFNMAGTR